MFQICDFQQWTEKALIGGIDTQLVQIWTLALIYF